MFRQQLSPQESLHLTPLTAVFTLALAKIIKQVPFLLTTCRGRGLFHIHNSILIFNIFMPQFLFLFSKYKSCSLKVTTY